MQYGRHTEVFVDGDTEVERTVYMKGGKQMRVEREIFEERRKVNNQLEEAAEYNNFARQYHTDPTMRDPSIRIEGKDAKQGYYYVVLTYTRFIE